MFQFFLFHQYYNLKFFKKIIDVKKMNMMVWALLFLKLKIAEKNLRKLNCSYGEVSHILKFENYE